MPMTWVICDKLWWNTGRDLLLARTDRNPSTTTKSTDDEVVAATDAKESANTDDNDTSCFCYCDAPEMDLVRLECCRNTIHRKCLLAHITNYPQCPYCRNVLPDIAKVFALPSIDRNSILVNTTTSLESSRWRTSFERSAWTNWHDTYSWQCHKDSIS
jgi:hypothetical protein